MNKREGGFPLFLCVSPRYWVAGAADTTNSGGPATRGSVVHEVHEVHETGPGLDPTRRVKATRKTEKREVSRNKCTHSIQRTPSRRPPRKSLVEQETSQALPTRERELPKARLIHKLPRFTAPAVPLHGFFFGFSLIVSSHLVKLGSQSQFGLSPQSWQFLKVSQISATVNPFTAPLSKKLGAHGWMQAGPTKLMMAAHCKQTVSGKSTRTVAACQHTTPKGTRFVCRDSYS